MLWPFFPRTSMAATEDEMIGEPPRAASNITPKVEKLANAGEAKVASIAWRSAEVPAGLKGASEVDSPPQPARTTDTNATVTTDRLANCSTRMGSASIRSEQLRAARASRRGSKAAKSPTEMLLGGCPGPALSRGGPGLRRVQAMAMPTFAFPLWAPRRILRPA